VERSRSDLPAEGYKKGDVISVQIGVRDLNTASGQAPGWSRYLIVVSRYHRENERESNYFLRR
jgi:hypothetical protein